MPTPLAETAQLTINVGDATVIYNGYIYICGRAVNGNIVKVSLTDYTDVTTVQISGGNYIDAIVQAGGYIWVGEYDQGWCRKIDPTTLAVLASFQPWVLAARAIRAMAADATYLYFGSHLGWFSSYKISDATIIESAAALIGGYVHSMVEDGLHLYGHSNSGTDRVVYKVLKSNLTLVASATHAAIATDDIVQDATYFYIINEFAGNLLRQTKADLTESILALGTEDYMDGMDLAAAKIYICAGGTGTTNTIYVVDTATYTTSYIATVSGMTDSLKSSDILISGGYLHLSRYLTGSAILRFAKFDLTYITTSPVVPSRAGGSAMIREFIRDPSLVLYLPLWKKDGASVMSDDARGHICTATGATWGIQGRTLDGSDDCITIPHSTSIDTMPVFAWEFWLKVSSWANEPVLIRKAGLYMQFGVSGIVNAIHVSGVGGVGLTATIEALNTTSFNHLIVTYDDTGDRKCYVTMNNVPCTYSTQTAPTGALVDNSASDLIIGKYEAALFGITGIIGEGRIYNRVLTTGEGTHNNLATKWRYAA